ncbi:uncharacterized protein VP01_9320g1, partial [Puccinia sorghi]
QTTNSPQYFLLTSFLQFLFPLSITLNKIHLYLSVILSKNILRFWFRILAINLDSSLLTVEHDANQCKAKKSNQRTRNLLRQLLQLKWISSTVLFSKTLLKPLLTMDNFTLWRNRVANLLDLQEQRKPLTDPKGVLTAFQGVQLRTVLTSKLNPSIHNNVINHQNEKDSHLIWASIMEFYSSSQPSNQARVFK